MLKIGISGASGRMGQQILQMINSSEGHDWYEVNSMWNNCKDDLDIISNHDSTNLQTKDIENAVSAISTNHNQSVLPDVFIDFSHPTNTMHLLQHCLKHSIPLVIGTTGFDSIQLEFIRVAINKIPILLAPNTSLSVNVLFYLVEQASLRLKDFEVEIIESHHRNKIDAPSGTALKLGEIIANSRGVTLDKVAKYDRFATSSSRSTDEIGFSVIRGGDTVGKHKVQFLAGGEMISLSSEITNRQIFATGALRAAEFLYSKRKNVKLYSMQDVISDIFQDKK